VRVARSDGDMCRSNYVKLLYAYEVYTTTGKKMTVEERAQFTCSKLSLCVVSMRDRKIVENMRQREARNGVAAAPAQWHRTGGNTRSDEQGHVPACGLEGRVFPTSDEGNADEMRLAAEVFGQPSASGKRVFFPADELTADAMRLAAEIFGPEVRLQAPVTYSRQERTAGATTTEGEAREDDKNVRASSLCTSASAAASSAKAPLPDTSSTGAAFSTPWASGSAGTSFGCSSAKAPLSYTFSTGAAFSTPWASGSAGASFGCSSAKALLPYTFSTGVAPGTLSMSCSPPTSFGCSSAKVPLSDTSSTGGAFSTPSGSGSTAASFAYSSAKAPLQDTSSTGAVFSTQSGSGSAARSFGCSSAKAPLPDTSSTGGAPGTLSMPCSSAPSFGCSSAKAPLSDPTSTEGSSRTSGVFGTGAAKVEAPVTATMSASLRIARVVTSAPAYAGVSSAKVGDVQTSFTGIKLTTSRVLTSAPALPLQAHDTASPVHGSKFIVKFRLSELPDYRGLKKRLKLQHTERTSLPCNGACFGDVLSNTHALQAAVSQPCTENTQVLLPIKREDV